jgi:hypothetical protein
MSATLISANPAYSTQLGAAHVGDSLKLLADLPNGSVNLVITSLPSRSSARRNIEEETGFQRQLLAV